MGCYDEKTIEIDFEKASKIKVPVINLLVIDAKIILKIVPDNQARDMAISHLLQAAEMVSNAYIMQQARK